MRERSVRRLSRVITATLLVGGCGGRAARDGSGSIAAAGSGAAAAAAGSSGALDAAAGDAGAAGGPELPTLDISGRWGVFAFGDPVGVELKQGFGALSGSGCDVGAPPLQNPDVDPGYCGPIVGEVVGNHASFAFQMSQERYATDVTVSADGTRMAGRFYTGSGQYFVPVAWLRVAEGETWLVATGESKALPGAVGYSLKLVDADPGATEYTPDAPYFMRLARGELWGDLGSFFGSELTRPVEAGPILVGPVPPTVPNLAVAMVIELSGEQFTKVTATTASGHHYTFSATPSQ